uniref:immunoglobulin superfamily member 1-like n=1 Tax=Geotrypetes seraphini TaxID=260995 RepID=UPI001458DF8E|nr:immunoglobulin superfamily member 1-like [Geotrypetes seraphini]
MKGQYTVNCSASWAHRDGLFKLYREGSPTPVQALKAPAVGPSVTFTLRSGGRYQCQYRNSLLSKIIWISAEMFPKPLIFVQPAMVLLQGESFAIRCQCPYPGVRFSLYKGRLLIEEQDPAGYLPVVVFHIHNASLQDGGRYRCYYHTMAQPVLWSKPSDILRINVQDVSHKPPIIWDTLGTANCSIPTGSFMYNQEDPVPREKGKAGRVPGFPTVASLDPEVMHNCSFRQDESDLNSDMGLSRTEAISQDWRSDFTEGNIARMGLAAAVLVLIIVFVAHACYRNRFPKRKHIQCGGREARPMLA